MYFREKQVRPKVVSLGARSARAKADSEEEDEEEEEEEDLRGYQDYEPIVRCYSLSLIHVYPGLEILKVLTHVLLSLIFGISHQLELWLKSKVRLKYFQ